jgi:enoyl-CoA hydratase
VNAPVLFAERGSARWITLNRPEALNALTHDMAVDMDSRLRIWSRDARVAAVVIEGTGGRAFCAGGDIRVLYEAMRRRDLDLTRIYYRDEYRLNRLIARYPKPYIALVDGMAMGGGVGVSIHGSHRIMTQGSLFAMPETGIGLFPDVGATYFLPRMPGALGMYVGLTGARLRAADALYVGFGTHYVARERWDEMHTALTRLDGLPGSVDRTLARFAVDPGPAPLAAHRAAIDRCFGAETLDGVFDALAREGGDFARTTLSLLGAKSPTSLAVTFRQVRAGATLSLEDAIRLEYRLTQRFVLGWDFPEGVRATIIDKDGRPAWRPARRDEVDPKAIDALFAPLEGGELGFTD